MTFHRCVHFVLDFLFPPSCVSCKRPGAWWCEECRDRTQTVSIDDRHVDGIGSVMLCGYYHDPRLRSAIQALKYHGVTAIRENMREYVAVHVRLSSCLPADSVLVPLPSSVDRVRARGFDQAEFIASLLGDITGLRVQRVFVRKRGSGIAQARLHDPKMRRANVEDSFEMLRGVELSKKCVLVDDVITTGSTVNAAADMLRSRGVMYISAFALARGA